MSATTHRLNRLGILCVAALALTCTALLCAGSASAAIEIESFQYETSDPGGAPTQQSGAHPEEVVNRFNFAFDEATGLPLEQARTIVVDLPLGATGSPAATPLCTEAQLNINQCPVESQLGTVALGIDYFETEPLTFPIYNMVTPPGKLAQFGFLALVNTTHLIASVRSEPDYGVTISVINTSQAISFDEVTTTFWGVPASSTHDEYRGSCLTAFGPSGNKCPSNPPEVLPFLTNPSACSATSVAAGHVDSWQDSGVFANAEAGNENALGEPIGIDGCDAVDFSPKLEARPTTNSADSPSGLDVDIHLPQNLDPNGAATAQLRDADIVLPPGLTINSASGAGLQGCSPAQIGLITSVGEADAHFSAAQPSCPDASRLGTVQLDTPLLQNPLDGTIYLASPEQNPFGSLLGLYIAVQDPATGVVIKLSGHPIPDPATGQLTVRFDQNPQLPFEDLRVNFFPGSRAALKTPLSCGQFTTTSTMVPWTTPAGANASPSDSFGIDKGPGGLSCPASEAQAANKPDFIAGTVDPTAAAFTPFTLKLSRADGTQPIKAIDTTLPKGLLAKLAGVPYCPEGAIAAAAGKSGLAEQGSPSCPSASQVGSVEIGAGAGSTPLFVGGKVYLAGPYKGAPLSLAIVTPAVAGPFDLGDVVVRAALEIDPETTQIKAVSDPIPTILKGIPLDLRSIALSIDRPSFTFNPTNCEPTSVTGNALSAFDQSVPLTDRFQVGGCLKLGFAPKLALSLKGATARRGHPELTATVTYPKGSYANISSAQVSLPGDELLDNSHIKTVCTRPQLEASSCPKDSIYGFAKATTPLLDKPLEGPVYLGTGYGHKLPDLVADLNGQIRVLLRGTIDTDQRTKGLRNTFEVVPDAPVSRFTLKLKGGSKGLIQSSADLCKKPQRATASFNGQNGKIFDSRPKISVSCGKKKSKAHRGKHRGNS